MPRKCYVLERKLIKPCVYRERKDAVIHMYKDFEQTLHDLWEAGYHLTMECDEMSAKITVPEEESTYEWRVTETEIKDGYEKEAE